MPRLFLSLLLSLGVASSASRVSVVVPNANASAAGNLNNICPFLAPSGMRYQQVFAASQFSSAMSIGQMALRNYSDPGASPFTATIPSIQISFWTVLKNPDALSATFASNVGVDNTVVYYGTLTFSSTNADGPGDTRMFDVIINLQTPFNYDPGLGNLLLGVQNFSGLGLDASTSFDAEEVIGDSVSRVWSSLGHPNATSGTRDSIGLIIRFESVPEPSSAALTGLGVALIAWRRRNS